MFPLRDQSFLLLSSAVLPSQALSLESLHRGHWSWWRGYTASTGGINPQTSGWRRGWATRGQVEISGTGEGRWHLLSGLLGLEGREESTGVRVMEAALKPCCQPQLCTHSMLTDSWDTLLFQNLLVPSRRKLSPELDSFRLHSTS